MTNSEKNTANTSLLGKATTYSNDYQPELLFPIKRSANRESLGINTQLALPFYGFDSWNAYELSWQNSKGKPIMAVGEFIFSSDSPYLVESKSLKLYLYSLTNKRFHDKSAVIDIITHDLSQALQHTVQVNIYELSQLTLTTPLAHLQTNMPGICLDNLDIEVNATTLDPTHLHTQGNESVTEILNSHLLKSNCPVTQQPDWGSVQISYTGLPIDRAGLLQYIISFRNHYEFGENCVERIFTDITHRCHPQQLSVLGRFTRRGGIDISAYRSTQPEMNSLTYRLIRQ